MFCETPGGWLRRRERNQPERGARDLIAYRGPIYGGLDAVDPERKSTYLRSLPAPTCKTLAGE